MEEHIERLNQHITSNETIKDKVAYLLMEMEEHRKNTNLGMQDLSNLSGYSRPSLYKTLNPNGNPSLANFFSLMKCIYPDVDIKIVAKDNHGN